MTLLKLNVKRQSKQKLFVIILVLSLVFQTLTFNLTPFVNDRVYAANTIYYVAKNGSDSNPGTESQPWFTVQKAANTLVAGDTVYVKAGIYNETVTPANSGSSGSWITYKAYPGAQVCIDGAGLNTKRGGASPLGLIFLGSKSYIEFDGFEIKNCTDWAAFYTWGAAHHLNFKNMVVHDHFSSGILLGFGGVTVTNILIDNVEVYNTNSNADQEGISLTRCSIFEIKNCKVHDIKGTPQEGIDCKVGCSNGSIHNNEVYNAQQGIYLDANNAPQSNIAVYNNNLHNNYDSGIQLGSEGTHQSLTGISIYNNIFYQNAGANFKVNAGGGFKRTFSFINNTTYISGANREIRLDSISGNYVNCVIRNNILVAGNWGQFIFPNEDTVSNMGTALTVDHNLFYSLNNYYDNNYNIWGTSYQKTNPLFTNPGGNNYTLQSLSPAINAGSATSISSTDYIGTARPQGAGYDIGAYEYVFSSIH
jgi:hypothetical protein